MRFLYFLILVAFLAAVGLFAWQNHEEVTLHYLDRTLAAPLSLLVGAVYVLGMLSGWTVVGMFKRSLQRVTERRQD
jgi:putative membrane protein